MLWLISEDSSGTSATQAEKEEVDSRSIYVGNVRFYDPLSLLCFIKILEYLAVQMNHKLNSEGRVGK